MYEIRVQGCAGTDEALALQEPIARTLCPEPEHAGPCAVPWDITLGDTDEPVLVVGVYTTRERAAEAAGQVREVVGGTLSVVLGEGDPGRFETLVEQYRIEHGTGLV
ncbi:MULTISPECIES: hypothetical protein [Streptomyces]|uniref:hypothetical protein n=1 Tax=Streptomyces TaxID=1883 RepID=UPI001C3FDE2A|nr:MULTISPECIES: hypothetical protein [Streptomyces]